MSDTLFISFLGQKGGVGKSVLARTTGVEYAKNGWEVKICDFNIKQSTSFAWNTRRLSNVFEPEISVEQFSKVSKALKIADNYNLMVFDGSPDADLQTNELAKLSDLIVLPTGYSLDDLEPTIKIAHEFVQKGIDKSKIAIALCRVGDSKSEAIQAQEYINSTPYFLLEGSIAESTGYRRALDAGKCLTETSFKSLNDKSDIIIQSIINRVQDLT